MYKYVFLLGRPGCGKSALYRELKNHILERDQARTFERVDDFPKLWAKFQEEDALERQGKERVFSGAAADGNYYITNNDVLNDVFNDILKEVSSDALKINKPDHDHTIFFEFARSNYVQALQNFDKRILDNCIAIYMQVDFDTCWARNVARHKAAIAKDGDDHLVPRAEMERLYLYDDQLAFVQYMQEQNIPVAVVNNHADGEEHLKKLVQELFDNFFKN